MENPMAKAVKMGSSKAIPEQDYMSRKSFDKKKHNRTMERRHKVSQRETTEEL